MLAQNPPQQIRARVFTSDKTTYSSEILAGSSEHTAHPLVDAGLASTTTEDRGYLDRATAPLRNAAATSIGLEQAMVSGR